MGCQTSKSSYALTKTSKNSAPRDNALLQDPGLWEHVPCNFVFSACYDLDRQVKDIKVHHFVCSKGMEISMFIGGVKEIWIDG